MTSKIPNDIVQLVIHKIIFKVKLTYKILNVKINNTSY